MSWESARFSMRLPPPASAAAMRARCAWDLEGGGVMQPFSSRGAMVMSISAYLPQTCARFCSTSSFSIFMGKALPMWDRKIMVMASPSPFFVQADGLHDGAPVAVNVGGQAESGQHLQQLGEAVAVGDTQGGAQPFGGDHPGGDRLSVGPSLIAAPPFQKHGPRWPKFRIIRTPVSRSSSTTTCRLISQQV